MNLRHPNPSSANEFPEWWPKKDGEYVVVVYRIMRDDFLDLHRKHHSAHDMEHDSDEFKGEVLKALARHHHAMAVDALVSQPG